MRITDKRFTIIAHTIFWTGYIGLIIMYFAGSLSRADLFKKALTTGVFQMAIVYFNLYYLIPRFFLRSKYKRFYFYLFLAFIIVVLLRVLADTYFFPYLHVPYPNLSTEHWIGVSGTLFIVLTLTSILRFMQERTIQERKSEELRSSQLDAELKFLKTQVNPHFLFNVLNNIYSLCYTNSRDAAPLVLKLSNMLRYILYEGNDRSVSLQDEVEYLRNYIELMKMQGDTGDRIRFEVVGNLSDVNIEPMIFIPFFENAFKHGNVLHEENGYIQSTLTVSGNHLDFQIENSMAGFDRASKDKVGGIGLENVKRRLDLTYPGRYELEIGPGQDKFRVGLRLKLKKP